MIIGGGGKNKGQGGEEDRKTENSRSVLEYTV